MNELLKVLNAVIVIIGIPTIIGACIYVGRKLQVLDDLNDTISKVKHNIKVVCDTLVQSKVKFDPNYIKSFSPFELTEKGTERIKELGFDKILAENEEDFIDFINSEKPMSKYDVEVSSMKSIIALFDNEYFKPIKKYLYNNPEVDGRKVRTTLAIYVRDKYFEKYPKIE